MMNENAGTLNTESILENLTKTLLYEGYALYPYHRSAAKNQKPIPFGVVFPKLYNDYNQYAHSKMQTECIVTGSYDLALSITIRFLHLKKIELFQRVASDENYIPAYDLTIGNKFYQTGWQTIERKISTGDLLISDLIKQKKLIPFEFDKTCNTEYLPDEEKIVTAKQIDTVSEINGIVNIGAAPVENIQNAFKVTVTITNNTAIEKAESTTRDEALSQSFLSTHTILQSPNGEFISHQNPGINWKTIIEQCENISAWPILIDEGNTTLLASPIVLYDYPKINPQSPGDLFDSTEIEEALLLHVAVLSDEEKKRIAQTDEKLKAMLEKVHNVTPEDLINFHSGLKHIVPPDNKLFGS
jgi:hydrogenase maturation protease